MTEYKKRVLQLANEISKDFFSEQKSASVEKAASHLFSVFTKQVRENSDEEFMYMMLKILMTEAMVLKGVKENGRTETDA